MAESLLCACCVSINAESVYLGNVRTLLETGDIVLYDAVSYYAQNEMELDIWRCQWG